MNNKSNVQAEIYKKISEFRKNYPRIKDPNLMLIPQEQLDELEKELISISKWRPVGYLFEYEGMKIIAADKVTEIEVLYVEWI